MKQFIEPDFFKKKKTIKFSNAINEIRMTMKN